MIFSQNAQDYRYVDYEKLYLECRSRGHNKFYEMHRHSILIWIARYGRIGTQGQTTEYSPSLWNNKLEEKLKKGYVIVDTTIYSLFSPGIKISTNPADINAFIASKINESVHKNVRQEYLDRINLILSLIYQTSQLDVATGMSKIEEGKRKMILEFVDEINYIKFDYITTGILTKATMRRLNAIYKIVKETSLNG